MLDTTQIIISMIAGYLILRGAEFLFIKIWKKVEKEIIIEN